MNADQIRYALSKQVPDMARGFTIQTCYGNLIIDAEYAPKFARLVKTILTNQLTAAEKREAS